MKVISLFILLVFIVSCSQKENKTNSDLDTLQKVNTNLITAPKADGFYLPTGLHVDRNNQIFVADQYNQRIQMFEYLGVADKH